MKSYRSGQSTSSASNVMTENTEIRLMNTAYRCQLARILDIADGWKELALLVTKPDCDQNSPLFSANDIRKLEEEKFKMSGSPTQALLEHWSTFGKNRPTIGKILQLLKTAQLYRAADYVAVDVLKTSPVDKPEFKIEEKMDSTPVAAGACFISKANLKYCDVFPHYSYNALQNATNCFKEEAVKDGGTKIGEGAYGSVYLGHLKQLDLTVAIKRLKDKMNEQFFTELEILSQFQHENLLLLLGYSIDGPMACLLYKYMENGSLQDRLGLKDGSEPIDWKQRINIAVGCARGICHLHNHLEKPHVHRDIKSANILLDKNLNPKVGDFGLARIGANSVTETTIVTSTVFGTSVYMAPEAFRGDISVKLDTFSYGIVLMELLTSLAPYDTSREETDILTFVQENVDNFSELIDNSGGVWEPSIAKDIFEISLQCAEERKKHRPTLSEVLISLEKLLLRLRN